MTASGCAGPELGRLVDLAAIGAYVTRTITLEPVSGPSGTRLVETPSGFLTELGHENQGVHSFLAGELPALAQQRVCTVVSVRGQRLSDYAELARRVGGAPGVSALEVGFPDEEPYAAAKMLSVVRRDVPPGVAVLAKVSLGAQLLDVARELAKAGAHALVIGHAHRGTFVDHITLSPFRGALSGPATHALALDAVWQVHETLPELPIVGVGGIRTGADALSFLAAGACAVQVGSALLHDPSAAHRVQAELEGLLAERGLKPADAVGIAHPATTKGTP
jgi:dihydroorotate dehydrogenase (NAD+) catalytic subunit